MKEDRLGHLKSNDPPLADQAIVALDALLAELEQRRLGILSSLERLAVTDHETTGKAADFIAICKTFLSDADAIRRQIKAPYDQAVKAIDSRSAGFVENVLDAIKQAETAIRTFRASQREKARLAAVAQRVEEARLRAAADAAERGQLAVDPEPPAEKVAAADIALPVARGDYGGKVHDKREAEYRITDVRALPDEILLAPKVQAAMLAAIKQLAKLKPDIPGVEKTDGVGENIRR